MSARSMVSAPVSRTLPSAARSTVAWPLADALPRSLSISRKSFRSSLKLETPFAHQAHPALPGHRTAVSVDAARLGHVDAAVGEVRFQRHVAKREPGGPVVEPPGRRPRSGRSQWGRPSVPPSVPSVCTMPDRLRSPPMSRSQSGRISPCAENRPRIGCLRAIAMRNGAAEASVGKVRLALAFRPWALAAVMPSVSVLPASRPCTTPSTPEAAGAPRPRAPASLASKRPVEPRTAPLQGQGRVDPAGHVLVEQAKAKAGDLGVHVGAGLRQASVQVDPAAVRSRQPQPRALLRSAEPGRGGLQRYADRGRPACPRRRNVTA